MIAIGELEKCERSLRGSLGYRVEVAAARASTTENLRRITTNMLSNILCTRCGQYNAATSCLCEFPLPLLCMSCLEKHRSSGMLHFPLEVRSAGAVNSDNFQIIRRRIYNLNFAAQSISSVPNAFSNFSQQVLSSFQVLEERIAALKAETLAVIDDFKARLEGAIREGIEEVLSCALYEKAELRGSVAKYLWTQAEETSTSFGNPYSFSVRCPEEEEIRGLLSLAVTCGVHLLPEFPSLGSSTTRGPDTANLSTEVTYLQQQKSELQALVSAQESEHVRLTAILETLGNDIEKYEIERDALQRQFSDLEDGLRKMELRSTETERKDEANTSTSSITVTLGNCQVCSRPGVSRHDSVWTGCPCKCFQCRVEDITGNPPGTCEYCDIRINVESIAKIGKRFSRCHVCGLAVPRTDIISQAPCIVCLRCVRGKKETYLLLSKQFLASCIKCEKNKWFNISKRRLKEITENPLQRACCDSDAAAGERQLPCGHQVCKVHEKSLKRCRKCNMSVKIRSQGAGK